MDVKEDTANVKTDATPMGIKYPTKSFSLFMNASISPMHVSLEALSWNALVESSSQSESRNGSPETIIFLYLMDQGVQRRKIKKLVGKREM